MTWGRAAVAAAVTTLLAGCGSTVPGASLGGPGGTAAAGLSGAAATAGGATGAAAGSGPGSVAVAGGPLPAGRSPEGSRTSPANAAARAAYPGAPGNVASGPRPPVQVGIVLTGTSNAADFGISPGNTFTERQLDDALIGALNARGGLAGRRIEPVYAQTDTGSTSWAADFQAACATFTQDHHVAAVVGYVFDYFPAFEQCLASHRIPHLNTGFNVPDQQELRAYPLEKNLDVPTVGRRTLTRLDGALARGLIGPTTRLGFLMDSCPGTQRSYDGEVVPYLAAHRLVVAKTETFSCAQGNSDLGSAAAEVQSAVLAFASAAVQTIVIHGVSEAGPTLLFAEDAESQNYHPVYLVTSLAQVAALGSHIPADQARNIHVFGWLPTQDVAPSDYPSYDSSQQRCLSLLRSQGLVPSSATDFYGAFEMCESFFLYQAALLADGADATGSSVIAAVDALGTGFVSSTNYAGASHYAAGVPDAVLEQRPLDYQSACTCWRYVGSTRPLPADGAT